MEQHEFAIYINNIDFNDTILKISDKIIYHRIIRVLRLNVNDQLILFNETLNLFTKIVSIDKNEIKFKVLKKNNNKSFNPKISIGLSLLKKEALEEAIYFCCELGANSIQPIITEKVNKKKLDENEIVRLKKILISASEQSKNFKIPELKQKINLTDFINNIQNKKILKIYCDVDGKQIKNILNEIANESFDEILILIGPEADLTQNEKKYLIENNFTFCSLTPTILRSQMALALSLGIFRSFLTD